MARPFVQKIVTANDLLEGDAIYLTASGDWSGDFRQGQVCTTSEQAEKLLAKAELQQAKIVGPYLADVITEENHPTALLHFREKFRTKGPSNYFHGKQAHEAQQGAL